MGLDIFENERISLKQKGYVQIEDWGFSVHFGLGFKKILFTLYTYGLAKILQNGAKFRYPKVGCKKYRNLNNFRQATESPNSWNLMSFCPKKYIPPAKTYTVDLSNITFNYFCVDSSNYWCHFWNRKSFFTTQLLCIFLAQTLHTSHKSSSSRCKFPDLQLLALKFTKFLMLFLEPRVSFSTNFSITLPCHGT